MLIFFIIITYVRNTFYVRNRYQARIQDSEGGVSYRNLG